MNDKVLTIEKVVFGGKGLSRDLEKVSFIPYTLAGEKVRVKIRKQRRDYLEAEAIEIVEPSRDRVPPDCRYFGTCGGCQISHARYEKQLAMKEEALRETMQRSHLQVPRIEMISGRPFGYRHRARFKFDPKRRKLGFFQGDSNQVTDIHECLCLTPGLNRLLSALRKRLLTTPIPRLTEIECYENEQGQTVAYLDATLPEGFKQQMENETQAYIREASEIAAMKIRFRNYDLPMHPDFFLQVNPGLWNPFVQEVEGHYENKDNQTAVELYSGAGFFTVPLSRKFAKIYAVEENRSAVRFAKENHQVQNIKWVCQKAENYEFPSEATALVVDPPRTGLHRNVVNRILAHQFDSLTYISCDCSSLARDIV